jgi:hypothetical protein
MEECLLKPPFTSRAVSFPKMVKIARVKEIKI